MFANKKLDKHLTVTSVLFDVYDSHDVKKGSHFYEFVDRQTKNVVISVYTYKKAKCIAEGIRLGFSHGKVSV
jgi:hypothetical protein